MESADLNALMITTGKILSVFQTQKHLHAAENPQIQAGTAFRHTPRHGQVRPGVRLTALRHTTQSQARQAAATNATTTMNGTVPPPVSLSLNEVILSTNSDSARLRCIR